MTRSLASLIGRTPLAALQRFWRDEGGVTAIEFALLAPPFFALIGMLLEASVMFLSAQMLDSAVHDATRRIRTGQVQSAKLSLPQFQALICERLFGMFDCSAMQISVTPIADFKSIDISPPVNLSCTASCPWTMPPAFDAGIGSSTMLVRVYYKWPLVLGVPFPLPNKLGDGSILMGAVDVFRNEPFGGV
jgi:Flp pilus assembly protein TadG